MYDFSKLKLDPEAIFKILVRKGDVLVCKEDIQFLFPKRFDVRGFNQYEHDIKIMGIFAIVDTKGNYAVHNIPNRISVTPNVTDTTVTMGDEFVVMTFYKDSVVSPNVAMVKDSSYLTDIYNEFFVLGKIPKFFSHLDVLKTFKLTSHFNGSAIGKYNAPLELLVSLIARDIDDKSKTFKPTATRTGKPGDIYWVGLSNVHYTVTSTLNKIGGAYASQAINSAIGNKVPMSEVEELTLL